MENICRIKNIGGFSHLVFLEQNSLANGLIMANGYLKFHKFEGEKLDDFPTILN